jgi:hypothetical protein
MRVCEAGSSPEACRSQLPERGVIDTDHFNLSGMNLKNDPVGLVQELVQVLVEFRLFWNVGTASRK